jgi:pimeloyl-ACP methyl ester carboxylesterase
MQLIHEPAAATPSRPASRLDTVEMFDSPFQRSRPENCRTVVLLPSSANSARQWDRLAEMLRPGFVVHAIEFHGHGERAARPVTAPLTLAEEATLDLPLMVRTGGAHVVGHSFGAAVALKLAAMRPDLVRSVVAYEPVLFRWLAEDASGQRGLQEIVAVAEAMRDLLAQNKPNDAARRFIDLWSGAGAWQSLPAARQPAIAARMDAVLQHFDALSRERMRLEHLARLAMPKLFLSGAQTVPAARRLAELLRAAMPSALHEVLPGMGHMGPLTHATEVNRRILRSLQPSTWLAALCEFASALA